MKNWRAYVAIARPDHWFKNAFMALGVALAFFYDPTLASVENLATVLYRLTLALIATCAVASSNYVLNEILDAPSDKAHPVKKNRPIPSGRVKLKIAYVEWILIGAFGLAVAWTINGLFFASAAFLWLMGTAYNVPPVRTKELPYLDVVSESINNPIRLLLGWFALNATQTPPISLILAYWGLGAFLMACKRWAELRRIGDREVAAAYRKSFRWYTLDSLMISTFFYAVFSALFLGIFFVRYHLELLISTPLVALFFAEYLRVTFLEDSPVQHPERLYKERRLMVCVAACCVAFFALMFVEIPVFYEWLNSEKADVSVLWRIDF